MSGSTAARWRCTGCGKPHAEKVSACENCGSDRLERGVVRMFEAVRPDNIVWRCTRCDEQHVRNSPPCKRCGNMEFRSVEYEYEEETRPTTAEVPSRWYRPLVWTTLAVPLLGGLNDLAARFGSDLGLLAVTPTLRLRLLGLTPILATLLVLPALLYLDASTLRRSEVDWRPSGPIYALGCALSAPLLFVPTVLLIFEGVRTLLSFPLGSLPVTNAYLGLAPPLVALYYLSERHWYVRAAPARVPFPWWPVLPAVAAVGLGSVAVATVAPEYGDLALAFSRTLSLLFPIAAYADAARVFAADEGWRPDPLVHFGLAYVAVLAFPGTLLAALYAAGYLYVRRRRVGRR